MNDSNFWGFFMIFIEGNSDKGYIYLLINPALVNRFLMAVATSPWVNVCAH